MPSGIAAGVRQSRGSSSGFWATPTSLLGTPVMIAYVAPAIAAPMMGPTMNNQTCTSAPPPANQATPSERAGFTEVPSIGMLARWITVKPRPIAIGANPLGARSVAPRMM
jgi:hypothetical protein